MKRFLIILIITATIFNITACGSVKNGKKVRIGVIDSCISNEINNKYNVTEINDIIGVDTENNITHGSMILSIIHKNVSNYEIFYCSIYDEDCIGKIDDVAEAIDWCIDNNVDIITMSFATRNDNKSIRESVERAIEKNIIITASCINLSDIICYPAMYDGVISVSEGFNSQAKVLLKGEKIKFDIDGQKFERREVSFLTAYVCSIIAKQISEGKTIEDIVLNLDFD